MMIRYSWPIASFTVSVLTAAILFLNFSTVEFLAGKWSQFPDGNYSHGYVVLAISLYLVFVSRNQLLALKPLPVVYGLLIVIPAGFLLLSGHLVDVQMLQSLTLLLLIFGVILTFLGGEVSKHLLFPIFFIIFALPIWFPLSPLLQDLTADVVFAIIRIIDIPAYRVENNIFVPAGQLSVEEACGGLNYLLSALTLGSLFAYQNYFHLGSRLLVVAIWAAAAILTNFIRVFVVVYLAYITDMQHPMVEDHLSLGWYLFGAIVILLLLADNVIHRLRMKAGDSSQGNHVEPVVSEAGQGSIISFKYFSLLAVVAASISLVPVSFWAMQKQFMPADDYHIYLPKVSGDWQGPFISQSDWHPKFQGAIEEKQIYISGKEKVQLYVGYYPSQQQGEELINSTNAISNIPVWNPVYPRAYTQITHTGKILEQVIEKPDSQEKMLVWYWYSVADHRVTSPYMAKLFQLAGMLSGNNQAAIVVITTDLTSKENDARERLQGFLASMSSSLDRLDTLVSNDNEGMN